MGRRVALCVALAVVGLLALGCGSVQYNTAASVARPLALGFNTQLFYEGAASAAREASYGSRAGATLQRTPIHWRGMQPQASDPVLPDEGGAAVGQLKDPRSDLAKVDRGYLELTSRHIRPIFIVYDAPVWATRYADCGQRFVGRCRAPKSKVPLIPDDKHLAAWSLFVEAVARRYPKAVIETWNEPNLYWGESDGAPSPEEMAAASCAAYDVVKALDPTRTVLSPGLADHRLDEYLGRMLDAGAARCWNVYSVHLYFGERTRFDQQLTTRLDDIRTTRASHGDRDPMWVTEAGWTTSGWFGVTESEQAAALSHLRARLHAETDVQAMVVHTLREAPASVYRAATSPEYGYGVLHSNWSAKPAYAALRDGQ